MYAGYVTAEEYAQLGYKAIPPSADLNEALKQASRQVDTLTFNRIVRFGIDNLTEFQQELVQEVVCRQAEFLYQNKDAIESIFDKYSINDVSMEFGTGFNVTLENDIPIQKTVYALLEQTGLCCRLAR